MIELRRREHGFWTWFADTERHPTTPRALLDLLRGGPGATVAVDEAGLAGVRHYLADVAGYSSDGTDELPFTMDGR